MGCLVPPPCSYQAAAFSTWTLGATCAVTVCLPPTDGICGVVPHTPCAVHPMPSMWISHRLAHASSLQWSSFLGTPPTNDHLRGVFAHPGQPSAPPIAHCQAARLLYGFPMGTTCLVAGHNLLGSWAHHLLPCLAALIMPPGSRMLS